MTQSAFRYTWDQLPDPGKSAAAPVSIVADFDAWKHFCIDSKHLVQKSPIFEEWLGTELYQILRDAWLGKCSTDEREQRLHQAGDAMDGLIRHAMNAPIVLVFDCIGISGGKQGEHWRLPLQNGVRMFVKRLKHHAILVTCFAPDAVGRALIFTHRWLSEIRNVVETYADLRNKELHLPSAEKQIPRRVDGKQVIHRNLRFHRPQTWGFDEESPGSRWSPPDNYPAAGPRFRLVPRVTTQRNALE